jgi:hypothetical protein
VLNEFEEWVSSHQPWLEGKRVSVEFRRRNAPTVAGIATFESGTFVASVTVWENGSCDVDMLNTDTGKSVFAKRYDFNSFVQLIPVLDEVCHKMAVP